MNEDRAAEHRAAFGPAPSSAYRNYVLAILVIVYIVNFIDRQLLSILLEPIKADLKLSDGELGLLSGLAFSLFYSVAGLPIARIADRMSRATLISVCLGAWSLMTGLSGLAQSYAQLLMARIGVAIGEAGCVPSSHSLISDYFPPEQRATALGIYSAGISGGMLVGLAGGGWIAELFGWRAAFLLVGLPGLLLAAFVWRGVAEPVRGRWDDARPSAPPASTVSAVIEILRMPVFVHLTLAAGLKSFAAYGAVQWLPSFFIRTHGLSTGEVGLLLGLGVGVAGLIGSLGGGALSDRLGRRDRRWRVWLPAIAMVAALPASAAIYLSQGLAATALLVFVSNLFGLSMLGPLHGVIQSSVPPTSRAMASATILLITNLIGMGAGPLVIGLLSDALSGSHGAESLRYAMLVATAAYAWSAAHFLLAALHMKAD